MISDDLDGPRGARSGNAIVLRDVKVIADRGGKKLLVRDQIRVRPPGSQFDVTHDLQKSLPPIVASISGTTRAVPLSSVGTPKTKTSETCFPTCRGSRLTTAST